MEKVTQTEQQKVDERVRQWGHERCSRCQDTKWDVGSFVYHVKHDHNR